MREALDLVQLGDLDARSASKLSGGQQQRVALARAFVFAPSVLLFDEPLSNLDAKLRAEMRVELKELQRRLDITSVYVTHDLEEALAISDRVIVMRDGVIEQIGTPGEIYDRPRNTFVADFVGSANLVRAAAARTWSATASSSSRRPAARSCTAPPPTAAAGAEALMAIRTVRLHIDRDRPRRPSTCGRAASASASSRATSRSTTWSGTAGSSSCAPRRPSRSPRATRSSSAPTRATASCWRTDPVTPGGPRSSLW